MTDEADNLPDPLLPSAALITGGARRIGAALVRDLAQRGWAVAVHCHTSAEAAEALCREITQGGGSATPLQADLGDEAAVAGLIERAQQALGPLGLLVNNASIFDYDDAATASRETWQAHLDINLRAPFVLTQGFAAALPAEARGLVVNMLDVRVWNLSPRYLSYTLSKSGLWTLTQTLAQALAPRIRVNGIGLGPTLPSKGQTAEEFDLRCSRLPLQNTPGLDEVCAALQFLLSARSMTGQMVGLDGGDHLTRVDVPPGDGV
ncbi:SDR family oxidoreductase [Pelagibius litoralis]|uniref:SDR family oxidoreductase n=1 Tax=Pelagibius litoralis TaxID=374515 RepID=A0A967F114_9PROT|nr:SDR family oxidoreductase [Pelagibius litoralis]NIA71156.1 SDR family oxidoreductase [Pelagibius litoralis]